MLRDQPVLSGLTGTAILACPQCKLADHVAGVELSHVYDGVLYWECWECGARWHRWPVGHYLYVRAVAYIGHSPEEVPHGS